MSSSGGFSTNTEILLMGFIGLVSTLYEVTTKDARDPAELIWKYEMPPLLEGWQYIFKFVIYGLEVIRAFTVHLYIASYLLLFYPVLTEHRRYLLAPWLVLTALRSILLNLVTFSLGIIICVTWDDSFNYPCVKFTTVKAAGMASSVYFFLTVHTYYYDLGRPNAYWAAMKALIFSSLSKTQKADKGDQSSYPRDSVSISSSELALLPEVSQGRRTVIERLLADASLEWFLNEAFGFEDIDDKEYEEGLNERAESFLKLTTKEILERRNKICPRVEELVRRAKLRRSLEFLRTADKQTGPESCIRDPLSRFPYLDISFHKKSSEDLDDDEDVDDISMLGNDLELTTSKEHDSEEENQTERNNAEESKTTKDEYTQTVPLTKSVEMLFDRMLRKNNNLN